MKMFVTLQDAIDALGEKRVIEAAWNAFRMRKFARWHAEFKQKHGRSPNYVERRAAYDAIDNDEPLV
jgi:hypothetical protein